MPSRDDQDPYALPPGAIEEPPSTWLGAMGKIGPGLILAGAIVGTGELIATTGLGAEQGYTLLWLIVFSCVVKVFVQTELGRYAIVHGKTTLGAIDTLPGPRLGTNWLGWLWLFMMLGTQAQIAAMEGLIGQAAHLAFPGGSARLATWAGKVDPRFGTYLTAHPEHAWATLTALAAVVLLLSGGYKRLERVTTVMVALVTLLTVLCVVALGWTDFPVHWKALAEGMNPILPTAGVALAFSTFGITGVGAAELFAYPYWCIEKGYARSAGARSEDEGWARRARGWIAVMKLDAWASMVVFTVGTVAYYILGAAVLHPQGLDPKGSDMLLTLTHMYVRPIGAWTRPVFLIGAWAVLFKCLYVATAGNSRLTADFLDLAGIWKQKNPRVRGRAVNTFCVAYPLLAVLLYFLLRDPKLLVKIGGFGQALMLPLIGGATLYLARRDADRRVWSGFAGEIFAWFAFFAMAAVAIFTIKIVTPEVWGFFAGLGHSPGKA